MQQSSLPAGWRAVFGSMRRRPLRWLGLGVVVLAVLYAYGRHSQAVPAANHTAQDEQVPEVDGNRLNIAKRLVTLQNTLDTLEKTVTSLMGTQQQLTRDQAVHKQAFDGWKKGLEEDIQQRLAREKQDTVATARVDVERQRRAAEEERRRREADAKKKASPPVAPPHDTPLSQQGREHQPRIGLYFEKNDGKDTFAGAPPAVSDDTPYLGVGCHAPIKVVTGVLAALHTTGLPMLLVVDGPFQCPSKLQGPHRDPLMTQLPLQGCLITGTAQANLSMERALTQTAILACVLPTGRFFEKPLKASVHGDDGILGLPGTVEYREGAKIGKALISGLLAGFAEAFRYAQSTTVVTPLGGVVSTPDPGKAAQTAAFGGLGQVANRASEFYWQQAQQLLPIVHVPSAQPGYVVIQEEGMPLEGLSPYMTVAQRR